MDIKQCFKAIQASKPMKFWYCAADGGGKPRLLLNPTEVPHSEIESVLATAKDKTAAAGLLKMAKSELTVVVKGHPPNGMLKHVEAVARQNGVKPKAVRAEVQALVESKELGAHYQGEDKKVGWRASPAKKEKGESLVGFLKRRAKLTKVRQSDAVTTKYDDDSERAESAIEFDAGIASTADGEEVTGKHGFVIDPKTGNTHLFKESAVKTPDGKIQTQHHSTPLAGAAVAGAGHMHFDEDGQLTKIDDQSGHYKPDANLTYQAVKHLDEQGALEHTDDDGEYKETRVNLLDKRAGISDEEWKKVRGNRAAIQQRASLNQLKGPLGEKAFAELKQKKPEQLKKLIASGKYKSIAELKASLGEAELKILEKQVAKNPGRLAEVALELHVELHQVNLKDGDLKNQTLVNFKIGQAGAIEKSKSQFLQSQGNEDQMRNKERMHDELRQAVAARERRLGREAGPSGAEGKEAGASSGTALNYQDFAEAVDERKGGGGDDHYDIPNLVPERNAGVADDHYDIPNLVPERKDGKDGIVEDHYSEIADFVPERGRSGSSEDHYTDKIDLVPEKPRGGETRKG